LRRPTRRNSCLILPKHSKRRCPGKGLHLSD
jgi:hypothetical protein